MGRRQQRHRDPAVRCRLVARDFKPRGEKYRADRFAAMPPLEAKSMLFRLMMVNRQPEEKEKKLMLIDVRKAHLNGKVPDDEHVYVELPGAGDEPPRCARLRRWLYGMRPAASAWEKDCAEKLEGEGFCRGASAPTVFHNAVDEA